MKGKKFSIGIVCILVTLLVTACCPVNPSANTAITAHGNTDWHIDTAEAFLFGTDMGGTTIAANHCPDTWTRRHMHSDLLNTNHFYYDTDLTTPGDDTDGTSGIETAMLFFYAGHGWPLSWDTLGNSASQGNVSLGDCPGGGSLRYYWQCSCEVFAHGRHYACPGTFDGSADSSSMRNVYERWGPALNPDLRMACGGSTELWCWGSDVNRIWDNYNNMGRDVADSFIFGLQRYSDVVPLCITMGGSDVTSTPLYDTTFTNQPNTSGTSHYHIQYLSHFASTPREPWLIAHVPELLPILEIRPMPLPEILGDVKFRREGDVMVSPDEVEGRPQVQVNRLGGAVYVLGERKPAIETVLEEEEYIERAWSFTEEQGWTEKNVAEPIGVRFMIARASVEGQQDDQQEFQKNVIVTFKRQIDVDGVLVNVLGAGGVIDVQMNNDGSVLNASKVWREIVDVKEEARVKTFDEAYKEALEQIENPQAYELDRWTWGYKEAAGNVEQTELRIVFRFWFVPADPETLLEYPPQMIEIPGQPQ